MAEWQTRQFEGLVPARASGFNSPPRHSEAPQVGSLFHEEMEGVMSKLFSPRSWSGDVAVGLVFLGSIGLITIVMLTLLILFSLRILR